MSKKHTTALEAAEKTKRDAEERLMHIRTEITTRQDDVRRLRDTSRRA